MGEPAIGCHSLFLLHELVDRYACEVFNTALGACVVAHPETAHGAAVQGAALGRSYKKRKATSSPPPAEQPDVGLQEAAVGVDPFSLASRMTVGRGDDVKKTQELIRSAGFMASTDTVSSVRRTVAAVDVRACP